MAWMGTLRPREGKALLNGDWSGAAGSQAGEPSSSPHCLSRQRSDVEREEVDSQGPARRFWEEPAPGIFRNSLSVEVSCRSRMSLSSSSLVQLGCSQEEVAPFSSPLPGRERSLSVEEKGFPRKLDAVSSKRTSPKTTRGPTVPMTMTLRM